MALRPVRAAPSFRPPIRYYDISCPCDSHDSHGGFPTVKKHCLFLRTEFYAPQTKNFLGLKTEAPMGPISPVLICAPQTKISGENDEVPMSPVSKVLIGCLLFFCYMIRVMGPFAALLPRESSGAYALSGPRTSSFGEHKAFFFKKIKYKRCFHRSASSLLKALSSNADIKFILGPLGP